MIPIPLPKAVKPLIGEPLRFYVQSRSRSALWHLVDLQEDGFRGKCGCENEQFMRGKAKRENPKERQRCWHVRQALLWFAEVQLRLVAAAAERRKETLPTRSRQSAGQCDYPQNSKAAFGI